MDWRFVPRTAPIFVHDSPRVRAVMRRRQGRHRRPCTLGEDNLQITLVRMVVTDPAHIRRVSSGPAERRGPSGRVNWRRDPMPCTPGIGDDLQLLEPVDAVATGGVMNGNPFFFCELRHASVADSQDQGGLSPVDPRVVDELLNVGARIARVSVPASKETFAT